jgi:hypothetical protein
LQESVVQSLKSLQVAGLPDRQVPAEQRSPLVQALESSQRTVLLVLTQPEAGLQESVVHSLESSQEMAEPAEQEPPAQASPVVQALLSLQAAVLGE